MDRCLLATALVLLVWGTAGADRVVLTDGRTLDGRTTALGDQVQIETDGGKITIARTEILKVEKASATRSEFDRRLAAVDRTNADALFALARWAREQGLTDEAKKLLAACVEVDPEHTPARRALGHVTVDDVWYPPGDALAIAAGWRAAGLHERVAALLPTILEAATDTKHRLAALRMLAEVYMRTGAWSMVRTVWTELLKETKDNLEKARLEARLAILKENPDGMWIVLGRDAPENLRNDVDQPSGFYALDTPWVLQLALREEAKRLVASGDAALDRARRAAGKGAGARVDRERAEAALRQADAAFTRAEAVSEGVAKGHRLELSRRRIGLERHEAEWYAARFDKEMEALQSKRGNRSAFRASLQRMVGQLNRVDANLETLLAIAAEHPDEMDLEIQWTRLDIERVRGYRKALRAEFDALR